MIISSSVNAGFAISCQNPSVALTGNSGGWKPQEHSLRAGQDGRSARPAGV